MVLVPEAMFPDQVSILAFELMLFLSKQGKPAEQSSSAPGSCCGLLITSCRSTRRLQSYVHALGRSSSFNRCHAVKSFCTFSWRKTSVERPRADIVSGSDTV